MSVSRTPVHYGIYIADFYRPDSVYSLTDDCACPADGLALDAIPPLNDEDRLQAVRMFLLPLDDEHAVGYSPFVTAARYC